MERAKSIVHRDFRLFTSSPPSPFRPEADASGSPTHLRFTIKSEKFALTPRAGIAILSAIGFGRGRLGKEVRPHDTTEGLILDHQPSVLIVDSSPETREVLGTALERQGVRILSASRAERGLELAREHHPDLIVLDLEVENSQGDNFRPRLRRSRVWIAPAGLVGDGSPGKTAGGGRICGQALSLRPLDS